jgi:transmembrane 9 superfamily protein 2/4
MVTRGTPHNRAKLLRALLPLTPPPPPPFPPLSLTAHRYPQALVALIMVRALKRDFSRYNRVATDEEKAEDREETGWKMVHADVFRPPKNPMLFSVVVGVGSQVMGMAVVTILFAAAGFLSPANRGSLMTSMLLVFLFMGAGAGYVAARTHKVRNACMVLGCPPLPGLV